VGSLSEEFALKPRSPRYIAWIFGHDSDILRNATWSGAIPLISHGRNPSRLFATKRSRSREK
jgi:hypothetical protein